jgi:hypothetical protein
MVGLVAWNWRKQNRSGVGEEIWRELIMMLEEYCGIILPLLALVCSLSTEIPGWAEGDRACGDRRLSLSWGL